VSEPGYVIAWTAPARRALARLPEKVATAVVEFLYGSLAASPHRVGKPLRLGLEGLNSARRGDYRVIYPSTTSTTTLTSWPSSTARTSIGHVRLERQPQRQLGTRKRSDRAPSGLSHVSCPPGAATPRCVRPGRARIFPGRRGSPAVSPESGWVGPTGKRESLHLIARGSVSVRVVAGRHSLRAADIDRRRIYEIPYIWSRSS